MCGVAQLLYASSAQIYDVINTPRAAGPRFVISGHNTSKKLSYRGETARCSTLSGMTDDRIGIVTKGKLTNQKVFINNLR